MKCTNCGTDLLDDASFCSKCGTKVVSSDNVKKVSLKCSACGGIMHIDEGVSVLYCPFCGAKEKIIENDAVKIEQIKADTYKEVEFEKLKQADEQQQRTEKALQVEKFKKGFFSKVLIVLFIIAVIAAIVLFSKTKILAGIVSVVQAGIFGTAWAMGMQIIKEKKRYIHIIVAVVGFLLIIPIIIFAKGFGSGSHRNYETVDWSVMFLGEKIPQPSSNEFDIHTNTENELWLDVADVSHESYYKYTTECKNAGYTIEADESSIGYEAFNEEGYKLKLSYYSSSAVEMSIHLEASEKLSSIVWADHAISKILPSPNSEVGSFKTESDDKTEVVIGSITNEDFDKYITLCKDKGFTVDEQSEDNSFAAYNGDGYHLELSYTSGSKTMDITLESPMKFSDLSLPEVGIASLLPVPPSSSGKADSDSDWTYSAYFENMTHNDYKAYIKEVVSAGFDKDIIKNSDEKDFHAEYSKDDDISVDIDYKGNKIVYIHISGSLNGDYSGYKRTASAVSNEGSFDTRSESSADNSDIRTSFKEAMDSYEAFFDEYCEFMKKYKESDDTTGMLNDLNDYMAKYNETMDKMSELKDDNLSAVELEYYNEVNLRITQKLAEASR